MNPLLLLATEAQVEATPLSWWVLTPTLVILVFALGLAPIWPWSKGWGWTLFGVASVTLFTVVVFTVAWLFS